MKSPKDVMVTTTSTIEGVIVKRYFKPVSAHVVAGTNLISDFLASWTDVFGGRSGTYQRQLASLYDEAIERIKIAAFELGANGVVGLKIDMDEISGKGKSMFMLTAVGTAILMEKKAGEDITLEKKIEKFDYVDIEQVKALRTRNNYIQAAKSGTLKLDEEAWELITSHQIHEIFPYIIKKMTEVIEIDEKSIEAKSPIFIKSLIGYLGALPNGIQRELIHDCLLIEENRKVLPALYEVIESLDLFDFDLTNNLLSNSSFEIRKRAVKIASFDKPFYSREDLKNLEELANKIVTTFSERGKRTMKKQLLSSKEREVWICECGRTNDIDDYCECGKNIIGFSRGEMQPEAVVSNIREKIDLLSDLLNS
ncbi:YbjQ family protein [Chitinophaga terrae (ex Kim and Jung 2007)]|nr:YbjQ family protein [Chitinophaga terrae (ex Kim and Jung 2007)]MDQ0107631.1 uncharacterized protein YbjQ (UPF0145 family)/CDGSH-type Zn-finger protein [Chitinophaga terrae (ex Kim and Jung 2007)]